MFNGFSSVNMDAKGRMALPTRYRDTIMEHCNGNLVATIDISDKCLLLYLKPEWQVIEQKISALSGFNKNNRRIQRLILGHAAELEMDSNGRILLPPPLRTFAGLDKKVALVGQGRKFEIWDEATWEESRIGWMEEGMPDDIEFDDSLNEIPL